MTRIAVVLFNLGGPDCPEAIKPFLANLFNDPAIIRLPWLLRRLAAKLIVAKRLKIAGAIYASIGGRSPILENTQAQAAALEKELAGLGKVKCFIAMRYWRPFAGETARRVKEFAPDRIVLLPLYPQFSTTTTASSLKSWKKAAKSAGIDATTTTICCYPDDPGFVASMAHAARAAYEKAKTFGNPRVLFSAHGLPEKIVKAGDPYQFQCERTAAALVSALGIEKLDWVLCYQSRVGPLKWIGPSTDEEIVRAGKDKVPVVIVPIAFTSENSETLYEIDILYRDLAMHSGVSHFSRVQTAGDVPEFITGLAGLVKCAVENERGCLTASGGRICPAPFSGCCNRE